MLFWHPHFALSFGEYSLLPLFNFLKYKKFSFSELLQMDSTYQHPDIQLYIMTLKPPEGYADNAVEVIDEKDDEVETGEEEAAKVIDQKVDEVETIPENTVKVISKKDDEVESSKEKGENSSLDEEVEEDCEPGRRPQSGKLTDWEARRYGSMAARLLHDIKIT